MVLKSFNIVTEEDEEKYIESIERLRKTWEANMLIRAERVLTAEKDKIIQEINKKRLEHKTDKKFTKRLLDVINTDEWKPFYKYLYKNVTKDFGERALNYYEVYEEEDEEEDWFAMAVLFIIPVVNKRMKEVVETSRDRLINVIKQSIEENGSITDLINKIEELYNHDIPIRSKNISTTEVITAGNIGIRYGIKSLSIPLKKKWIAVMDERTRETHWNTNGEVRNIDELYSNGLMFPGDPTASAEEVCGCRCIESFIT